MKGAWPNNFAAGLLFGSLLLLLATLVMGAVQPDRPLLPVAVLNPAIDQAVPLSSTGRYQLVTWEAGGAYGALVLDTATGVTKIAYSAGKGPGGKAVNNLGKPFTQM